MVWIFWEIVFIFYVLEWFIAKKFCLMCKFHEGFAYRYFSSGNIPLPVKVVVLSDRRKIFICNQAPIFI